MTWVGPALDWARDGADWPNRAASRFVEAGGLTWHVQSVGQGPVLLLVHGTGASTHSWRALMPLLARRWRVVAMDLPSHAFTEAPEFADLSLTGMARLTRDLLRVLEVSPAAVVGHSAGVAILTRLILDGVIAPERVVSLNGALLPFGGIGRHLFPALASLMFTNPLTARLVALSASRRRVEALLRDTGSTIDAEGLKLYTRLFGNPRHVAGALGMMANWRLFEMEGELKRLQPRMLLVSSERDRAIPPAQAEQLRAIIPQAQLLMLAGLGHLAHEEDPARACAVIEGFCSGAGGTPIASGP